jgi:hypothetical protein
MLRISQPYGLIRLVGLLVIVLTLLSPSLATGASVGLPQGTAAGEQPKYGGSCAWPNASRRAWIHT